MHIIPNTRTKKTFCWCYTKYTRKLQSVSLKARVKCRREPLKDRCFDFTDEFKHSELSHFTLQTSIHHTKSKMEKHIFFLDCIYLKVKSQKRGLPARQLGMFFLSTKDESQSQGTQYCCSTALMFPNSNFILKTIFADLFRFKLSQK